MLEIRLDRFAFGALAEELNLPIKSGPDPYERDEFVSLYFELAAGTRGKVKFHTTVPKSAAVVPPEFREVANG